MLLFKFLVNLKKNLVDANETKIVFMILKRYNLPQLHINKFKI